VALCLRLIALLLALALPQPALADWSGFNEWGLSLRLQNDVDIKGGNLEGMGLGVQTSASLYSTEHLRLDLRLELAAGGFWNYADGAEISFLPALRLYCPPPGNWSLTPFLEAGLGLCLTNLHIPEVGSRLNFLSMAGLGLRYCLSPRTFLDLGYRLRHLSNAGLDQNNHGVTSNSLGLELGWFF
jgi:hypothetical protein